MYILQNIYSNWKMLCMSWRKVSLTSSISRVLKLLASCDTLTWDLSRQEAKPSPPKLPLREENLSVFKLGWASLHVNSWGYCPWCRHFLTPAFQKYPELLYSQGYLQVYNKQITVEKKQARITESQNILSRKGGKVQPLSEWLIRGLNPQLWYY